MNPNHIQLHLKWNRSTVQLLSATFGVPIAASVLQPPPQALQCYRTWFALANSDLHFFAWGGATLVGGGGGPAPAFAEPGLGLGLGLGLGSGGGAVRVEVGAPG